MSRKQFCYNVCMKILCCSVSFFFLFVRCCFFSTFHVLSPLISTSTGEAEGKCEYKRMCLFWNKKHKLRKYVERLTSWTPFSKAKNEAYNMLWIYFPSPIKMQWKRMSFKSIIKYFFSACCFFFFLRVSNAKRIKRHAKRGERRKWENLSINIFPLTEAISLSWKSSFHNFNARFSTSVSFWRASLSSAPVFPSWICLSFFARVRNWFFQLKKTYMRWRWWRKKKKFIIHDSDCVICYGQSGMISNYASFFCSFSPFSTLQSSSSVPVYCSTSWLVPSNFPHTLVHLRVLSA